VGAGKCLAGCGLPALCPSSALKSKRGASLIPLRFSLFSSRRALAALPLGGRPDPFFGNSVWFAGPTEGLSDIPQNCASFFFFFWDCFFLLQREAPFFFLSLSFIFLHCLFFFRSFFSSFLFLDLVHLRRPSFFILFLLTGLFPFFFSFVFPSIVFFVHRSRSFFFFSYVLLTSFFVLYRKLPFLWSLLFFPFEYSKSLLLYCLVCPRWSVFRCSYLLLHFFSSFFLFLFCFFVFFSCYFFFFWFFLFFLFGSFFVSSFLYYSLFRAFLSPPLFYEHTRKWWTIRFGSKSKSPFFFESIRSPVFFLG